MGNGIIELPTETGVLHLGLSRTLSSETDFGVELVRFGLLLRDSWYFRFGDSLESGEPPCLGEGVRGGEPGSEGAHTMCSGVIACCKRFSFSCSSISTTVLFLCSGERLMLKSNGIDGSLFI